LVSSLGRGGRRTDDGPRRRTRTVAVVACIPARGGVMQGRAWPGSVQGTAGWVGTRRERTGGIAGGGFLADGGVARGGRNGWAREPLGGLL
jgi:hypothetical protein